MVKKFTANCDFGGQKAPVDLYVGNPATGSHPLAFQSKWLATSRNGNIPPEIMNSFAKLVEISEKNRVPFEDLCEYVIAELRSANTIAEDVNKATELSKNSEKKMINNKHIAVLMGGWNSEREVSLRSGEAVFAALNKLGYKATKIDFSRKISTQLQEVKPDIVFNALHGKYGEDGRVQGVLDILQIPYTHSGIVASAICMDKVLTRKICTTVGVKSPHYEILKKGAGNKDAVDKEDVQNKEKIFAVGKPLVIKPISEGSSVGVEVILPNMQFDFAKYEWKYGNEVIVEKYLAGQEIQVAVMDGKALGAIEVRPHGLFYDYKCKYTAGMTDYIMPAEISAKKYAEVLDLAERCHAVVGCRGVSRIDFILNNKDGGDDNFYLLETNTHPGFTETSLVPKIAKHVGISFEEIVEFLVKTARCE